MTVVYNHKCCSNCEFWQGAREPEPSKTRVQIKNTVASGRCMERRQDTRPDYGACQHYKRWGALK